MMKCIILCLFATAVTIFVTSLPLMENDIFPSDICSFPGQTRADELLCHQYYICDETGYLSLNSCPDDQLFDILSEQCDDKELVDCHGRGNKYLSRSDIFPEENSFYPIMETNNELNATENEILIPENLLPSKNDSSQNDIINYTLNDTEGNITENISTDNDTEEVIFVFPFEVIFSKNITDFDTNSSVNNDSAEVDYFTSETFDYLSYDYDMTTNVATTDNVVTGNISPNNVKDNNSSTNEIDEFNASNKDTVGDSTVSQFTTNNDSFSSANVITEKPIFNENVFIPDDSTLEHVISTTLDTHQTLPTTHVTHEITDRTGFYAEDNFSSAHVLTEKPIFNENSFIPDDSTLEHVISTTLDSHQTLPTTHVTQEITDRNGFYAEDKFSSANVITEKSIFNENAFIPDDSTLEHVISTTLDSHQTLPTTNVTQEITDRTGFYAVDNISSANEITEKPIFNENSFIPDDSTLEHVISTTLDSHQTLPTTHVTQEITDRTGIYAEDNFSSANVITELTLINNDVQTLEEKTINDGYRVSSNASSFHVHFNYSSVNDISGKTSSSSNSVANEKKEQTGHHKNNDSINTNEKPIFNENVFIPDDSTLEHVISTTLDSDQTLPTTQVTQEITDRTGFYAEDVKNFFSKISNDDQNSTIKENISNSNTFGKNTILPSFVDIEHQTTESYQTKTTESNGNDQRNQNGFKATDNDSSIKIHSGSYNPFTTVSKSGSFINQNSNNKNLIKSTRPVTSDNNLNENNNYPQLNQFNPYSAKKDRKTSSRTFTKNIYKNKISTKPTNLFRLRIPIDFSSEESSEEDDKNYSDYYDENSFSVEDESSEESHENSFKDWTYILLRMMCKNKKNKEIIYRDPFNCNRFLVCNGNNLYFVKCPKNMWFDEILKRCNERKKVKCYPNRG